MTKKKKNSDYHIFDGNAQIGMYNYPELPALLEFELKTSSDLPVDIIKTKKIGADPSCQVFQVIEPFSLRYEKPPTQFVVWRENICSQSVKINLTTKPPENWPVMNSVIPPRYTPTNDQVRLMSQAPLYPQGPRTLISPDAIMLDPDNIANPDESHPITQHAKRILLELENHGITAPEPPIQEEQRPVSTEKQSLLYIQVELTPLEYHCWMKTKHNALENTRFISNVLKNILVTLSFIKSCHLMSNEEMMRHIAEFQLLQDNNAIIKKGKEILENLIIVKETN